jgi:hypothetical protein
MTKIKFNIPRTINTKIAVYDILGKEVAVILNEKLYPGEHEVDLSSVNLPEGTYFYKLIADGFTETKKMLLIK